MKKLLLFIALFACFKAYGQTPTNPTPVTQMSWYKDFTGHMWAYRGATLGWVQMVDLSQLSGIGSFTADNGLTKTGTNVQLGGSLINDTQISGGNHYFQLNNTFSSNSTDSFVRTLLLNNEIGSPNIGTFISSNYSDGVGDISSTGSLNTWNFGAQLLAAFTSTSNSINARQRITVGKIDGNIPTVTGSKIEILDDVNFKGAQYAADYSAVGKLDNLWIPHWGAVKSLVDSVGGDYVNLTTDQTKAGSISFNGLDGIISNGTGTQKATIAGGTVNVIRDVGSSSALQVGTTDGSSRAYLTNGYFGAATPLGEATFRDNHLLYENSGAVLSIALPDNFTGVNTIKWPENKSGTVALTSDVPSVTGLVPYTGAISDVDLNNKNITSAGQFIYPSSGQPLTTYKNSIYPVKSFIGMQGSPEANFSFNMDYNLPGLTGIHQYGGDPTLGAIWYAAGGTRGWCMQYAPANIANTGVNVVTFTGGSGYTNGTYAVSATGGSGTGEILNITVSGGVVVACTAGHVGDNYVVGDVLGASGIGPGSGFSATVVSLIADIWYKSGQKMFLRGDVITNTLTLGATGASNPVVGAGVQVERTLGVASMSGTTASNGFVLNGSPLVLTAAPVYLNHDNTGTVFIAGGNGAAQFGTINTIAANVKYNFLGSQIATTSASGHKFGVSLIPTANGQILTEAQFTPTFSAGTGALTATITTSTTSLGDGTYDNLSSTATSGTGSGQTWKVTVLGGVVTAIVPATSATGGIGYAVGNTFTVNTVTGAVFTVATLGYTGSILTSAQFNVAPIQLASLGNPTNPADGMFYFTGTSLRLRASGATNVISMSSTVGANTQVPIYNSSGILVPTTPTGTGAPVLQTSPSFVTPALGTPASGVMTNVTGLPTTGLVNNAVTYAKMQAMTTNKLLGSGSGTSVAEITLGTGLSFTGTTLNSTNLTGSATLDFSSTAAQSSSELTITVTGAADGDVVSVGVPNVSSNANSCFTARVSATNTVTVKFNNYSTGAIDPASGTFKVTVFK